MRNSPKIETFFQNPRYEPIRCLGEGATAQTFLCKDRKRGGRSVALKLFNPDWSRRRSDLIDREFRTLSALSHPYIARVLDFGRVGERYFLVSEWIEGAPFLEALHGEDLSRTLWLFTELLEALDYLYFRNVVHLDLKPQNVLVEKGDIRHGFRVRLIDFGLASFLSSSLPPPTRAIGTPPFTAPEFALRRPLSTRSDLYSVGMLLYFALALKSPFEGEDLVAVLNEQLSKDPPSLKSIHREISLGLSDFVLRLIARDPKERFENPRLALHGLQQAMGETVFLPALSRLPLFEDPDLSFRPALAENLLLEILSGMGPFAVEGERGAGKTFLARWLERNLLLREKPVVFLEGDDLLLLEDDPSAETVSYVLLIDDADQGITETWLASNRNAAVILFGKNLQWALKKGFRPLSLNALSAEELGAALEKVFGPLDFRVVIEWEKKTQGHPARLLEYGRNLFRRGLIEKQGLGWNLNFEEIGEGSQGLESSFSEIDQKIISFLSVSEVSLDSESLAAWVSLSVEEVEERLKDLAREGHLTRKVEGGREIYRSNQIFSDKSHSLISSEEAVSWIEGRFDSGQYREGLEAFLHFFPGGFEQNPDLILLKSKLQSGAGDYEEVFQCLNDRFLRSLSVPQQALGLETVGKSLLFTGRFEEAELSFARSFSLYNELKDQDGKVRTIFHRGILSQRKGEFSKAKAFYDEALTGAGEAKSKDLLQGVVLLNLGNLAGDSADFAKAEELYEKSLSFLRETGHGPLMAQAYLNKAQLSFNLGKLLLAEEEAREALKWALHHRYFLTQGRALLLKAMVDERKGDSSRQALRLCEAVEVFRRSGLRFELAQALIQRSYLFEVNGDYFHAESDAREALEIAESLEANDAEGQARFILGKIVSHDPDRLDEAERLLEGAQKYFKDGKISQMEWTSSFELAGLKAKRGNRREAERLYESALKDLDRFLEKLPEAMKETFLRDKKRERIFEALKRIKEDGQ